MYSTIRILALFIFNRFGRLVVVDKQHLPKTGGFVVACTHVGWVEIVWLALAVWPRSIHYMAKEELFQNRWIGFFLKKLQAFPVNRRSPGPSSLKIPLKLLEQGEIIGIFPSGTRTQGKVPLKQGAARIAQLAGVPLVPAVYMGPSSLRLRDFFKRKPVAIIFGQPITTESNLTIPESEQREIMMRELNTRLSDLFRRYKNETIDLKGDPIYGRFVK
jgi:1-acyl-sn-glycerol-3-phosphate acyltransferase